MSELKFCVDCKWHVSNKPEGMDECWDHLCSHPDNSTTDLVTGEDIHETCAGNRFSGSCLEEALHWEAK